MGLLDKLLGREEQPPQRQPNTGGRAWYESGSPDTASMGAPNQRTATAPMGEATGQPPPAQAAGTRDENERAINRYRYLLRTAPPETIEQVHADAFAQLTPEQRQQVLDDLKQEAPEHERAAMTQSDPQSLARSATRAEMRQPGVLERTFSRGGAMGGGIGMGGLLAGSFLSTIAGVVVGSAIANAFFDNTNYNDQTGDSADTGDTSDTGSAGDTADSGADANGQDMSGQDVSDPGSDPGAGGYGDVGGNVGGDMGGDFGGGDLGGGDFGGDV